MSTIDLAASPSDLRSLAEQSNAWPFEQAKAIVARLKKKPKDEVLFETGYGPSGLPHIGTFGEVARTTMVRHAFRVLTEDKMRTRLIAFSDDMDGLRKVPDNIPNKDMVARHLGKPLTRVPDPFGTHPSFGAHNNARLRAFLDAYGFDYEFMSSTACYASGRFDQALLTVLARFDEVMAIMLPSLRAERAGTYSPFLPVSPRSGVVLQVPIVAHDVAAGTIQYDDPDTGERMTTPATGGLQLRIVPGRQGPEDFEVEGQWHYHRGMAALCEPGKPVVIHVPRAEGREAPPFRCHSAPRRRVSAVPGRLRAPGGQAAAHQSGVAHPRRPSASSGSTDLLHHAAQSRLGVECRECRDAVGFHRPLLAGRDAAKRSETQRACRARHPLFPRLRAAGQKVPRGGRDRACSAHGSARGAVATAAGQHRGKNPGSGLRDRPPSALPRHFGKDQDPGWQARRVARMVQHALPGAARPGEGSAF